MMPSSRRRVSELGMAFRREAKELARARLRMMVLTIQVSIAGAGGFSPDGDLSRPQICMSP